MNARSNDPFDRIEAAANRLARRVLWEQGNRIGLLRVHAWVGLIAGAQMLAFGGPSTLETIVGTWVRLPLGVIGMLGGLLLIVGLRSKPRSIHLEATGLALIGLWDLAMTCGLAYARTNTTSFGLRWPWVPLPPPDAGYVTPYPIAVYGGLFVLIVIHLWTLHRFRRAGAPPAGTTRPEDIP